MPHADMATTSLSVAKRCMTNVDAKPAANGMANCSIGTIAKVTYLKMVLAPIELSASGFAAAPKAMTVTITDVVTANTRSNSQATWRHSVHGIPVRRISPFGAWVAVDSNC